MEDPILGIEEFEQSSKQYPVATKFYLLEGSKIRKIDGIKILVLSD